MQLGGGQATLRPNGIAYRGAYKLCGMCGDAGLSVTRLVGFRVEGLECRVEGSGFRFGGLGTHERPLGQKEGVLA